MFCWFTFHLLLIIKVAETNKLGKKMYTFSARLPGSQCENFFDSSTYKGFSAGVIAFKEVPELSQLLFSLPPSNISAV